MFRIKRLVERAWGTGALIFWLSKQILLMKLRKVAKKMINRKGGKK
jgi:hypothetical protein